MPTTWHSLNIGHAIHYEELMLHTIPHTSTVHLELHAVLHPIRSTQWRSFPFHSSATQAAVRVIYAFHLRETNRNPAAETIAQPVATHKEERKHLGP